MADDVFFYGAPGTLTTGAADPDAATHPGPAPPAKERLPPARSWAAITKPSVEQPVKAVTGAATPLVETAPPPEPLRPKTSVQCSFFLAGSCYFGDSCRYRHDVAPSSSAVEWFRARIDRERASVPPAAPEGATNPAPDAAPPVDTSAASFEEESARWQLDALRGKDEGGGGSGSAGGGAVENSDEDGILEAVATGVCPTAEAAEVALQAAERAASADALCSVCLERVLEERGRRFGLLTGCMHVFCLACIREWRARIDKPTATVRACPVCRVQSFFVIPSDRLLVSARRKAQANADFTASQRALPCRLFNLGRGTCAFGSSCWYAHLLPDGTPAVLPKPVFRVDAEGAPASVRGLRLNEFLG